MSSIIATQFNDQKIILIPPFFAHINEHTDRDLHSHNCIELSYVLSGTAQHVLIGPDGVTRQQKLCRGNYMILDASARHGYKNGSKDFSVINLLCKQSFLRGTPENAPAKGIAVARSAWHGTEAADTVELRFGMNKPRRLKDVKYLRLWIDLGGDGAPIDLGKACIGLIADGDAAHPYITAEGGAPFYFLGEGETKWTTLRYGKNGRFGSECGASVAGLRGWLAFPVSNMVRTDTGEGLGHEKDVTDVFFRYTVSHKSMAGRHLYMDDISLVRDRHVLNEDATNGGNVVDFHKDILRVSVSGADGSLLPEAHPEDIKVSLFDGGDFYALIKELFPDFKYSKIPNTPVNQIYFDKDGDVLSLFRICHRSSRGNYHEWHRTVRHALSLILILSLQSFDRYIRSKKESIIDTVKAHVEAHFSEDVTLTDICAKHFYSLPYVSHRFKEVCGCSFEQYVRQVRIKHAGELLLDTALSVGEIAERCGYASPRSFRKAFTCVTGLSPLAFKRTYQK